MGRLKFGEQLLEDSGALEIAAHSIQFLVEPQGLWHPPDQPFATPLEFLQEGVRRMHRLMEQNQQSDPFKFLIYAEMAGAELGPVA